MTAVQPFDFEGQQVRVVSSADGEPAFVLSDLCRVLGITNVGNVAARLDADMVSYIRLADGTPGNPNKVVVTEAGMYEVVIRSDKPEAKAFRRWVTAEVLPAIRKHGGYLTPEAAEAALTDPDFIIRLATSLKEEREARQAAEAQAVAAAAYAERLEPAASAWAEVMDAEGTVDLNTAAKMLGTGRTRLMRELRLDGILTIDNLPKQQHIDAGRFEVKVGRPWRDGNNGLHLHRSTRVTAKGIDYLASRYNLNVADVLFGEKEA